MALIERSPGLTVSEALSRRAASDPDRPFLLTRRRTLTFGEVERDSTALAAALANVGVTRGDRVAVILPGRPEFVVAYFAIAKLGAVIVPLSPLLSEPELQYKLRHTEAVCAITVETYQGRDYLQFFEGILPNLPELGFLVTVGEENLWYDDRMFQYEDLLSSGSGRSFPSPEVSDDALLAIVYSAGGGGKPRGVEITHGSLLYAAGVTAAAVRLSEEDRVIGVTTLFHVFGLGPGILGSVLSGAALVLQEEFDAEDTLDRVVRHRVTVHYGVPSAFAAELQAQRARPRDLSTLRAGVVAGAPLREDLFREVEEEICPILLNAYSMTEASSTLAVASFDDPAQKRRFTVGRPVPGTTIRIVERDGTDLPPESVGELAVRGPGVMRGYYRQPRETSESFDGEEYFRTGDLAMLDEDGYLHIVGSLREVINRAGFNVFPREVEERLHAHPAVDDAAVVGIPDPVLGEAVCAAVVLEEGAIVNAEEIQEWCRGTLAGPKVPDLVKFFDALPMSAAGKVSRIDLVRLISAEGSLSA